MRDCHGGLRISRRMSVRREEYLDYMTFRGGGPIFKEFLGPFVGLREQWAVQGASAAELDFSAFPFREPELFYVPVHMGFTGNFGDELIEETDEHVIGTDYFGRRMQLFKKTASLPLPLDYVVRNMDDWRRFKPSYEYRDDRFADGWENAAIEARRAGKVITVGIPGGFDEPRQLMGEEELCVAYYEQPELIHDMLGTMADCAIRAFERLARVVPVDELAVHEDMASNHGPLAGPAQVREFMRPYFRRVWEFLAEKGARVFAMDSDGRVDDILEPLIECGLNVIGPMEPASGTDAVAARRRFGRRLAFFGTLDKFAVLRGPEAIDKELEYRLPPLLAEGGCALSLDHRILPGTTLANYRYYIRRAWEIIARETGCDVPVAAEALIGRGERKGKADAREK